MEWNNLTIGKKITLGMGEGADQVVTASSLVSSASQSLAEGSSVQVASIKTVFPGKKTMLSRDTKKIRSDQVIPFDDDDNFKKFLIFKRRPLL